MTEQEFKNSVAEILKDKIHFSPQLDSYVIHGALDEIWQLHILNPNPCQLKGRWVHAFKDEAEFLEYLKMQREWDKLLYDTIRLKEIRERENKAVGDKVRFISK